MNIKTANKLQQLRKEKGYTQESLADALGISRQAVSKWERAEASPDTDNLICLAKLYGISIDELLDSENSYEDIKEDNTNNDSNKEVKEDKVHIGLDGIRVVDKDGDEVHINCRGIHVKDIEEGDISIGIDGIHHNRKRVVEIVSAAISLLITITYLLLGSLLNLWHPAWILFLFTPVITSIVECIYRKKITAFNYPVLVTIIYLYLGFYNNLWHPLWVIFITIPVFYIVFSPIENLWLKKTIIKNNKEYQ